MKNFKSVALKMAGMTASLALMVAAVSNSAACIFWFHQPEVPEGVKMLKK